MPGPTKSHAPTTPSPAATAPAKRSVSSRGTPSVDQAHVNLKLAPSADQDAVLRRLSEKHGLRNIEPLFPGESLPELASIYTADMSSQGLRNILPEIESDPEVEYIEEPAPRKLIR